MVAYISATFEKDLLPLSGNARVITRLRDDGAVPPVPTLTYYPTSPDTLAEFLVGEYISDIEGERWVRVATLADYTGVPVSALSVFEDMASNFIAGGVQPGDELVVTISSPELWVSDEYAAAPFTFTISSVLNAQQLSVVPAFPAFAANLTWAIAAQSMSGVAGVTRRTIVPVGGGGGPTQFRDRRLAGYFSDAVMAENYIAAIKAGMTQLANESTGSTFVDEAYTGVPT